MEKEEFLEIEKYIQEGKIKEALKSFRKFLEQYPESLPLKLSYADFLLTLGEPFEALVVLREGLKINSEDLNLRYLLGVAQQKVNRFHLAEKEFEFVRERNPFDPEIQGQLGWTKVMRGGIEGGRKLLREAISADLTNPLPYIDLGASYILTLNFDEGFRWLETAKNLDPKNPFILEKIDWAREMEKDFEKFSEKDKDKMRRMRNDPKELKLAVIEQMLILQSEMIPTKEEMEDVKRELELAGLNPQLVEFQPPETREQKIQVEYLKYHQKVEDVERKISKDEFEKLKAKLLNPKTSSEETKKILIILAHQGKKEATELLEKYQKEAPVILKDFAKLALEECKILSQAKPGKIIRIIH